MAYRYVEYQPSPDLRPFVCSYGWFATAGPDDPPPRSEDQAACEYVCGPDDPMADWLLPCVHTFLNFNLGDPFALAGDRGDVPQKEPAHVIGLATRPGRLRLSGRVEFFGVSFRAGCAHHFLRVPAVELTDQFLDLGHFWGAASRTLPERLREAPTARARIRLVEAELRRRLAAAPRPDRLIAAVADHVQRCGGLTTIARLSAACGFSRQHLTRRFRRVLGVGPKTFCRLVRFQNALTRTSMFPPDDWAAAAMELGYYDQAHLIAEFKEFTGYTPTGFAALC